MRELWQDITHSQVKKCRLAPKLGHKMSRRELLKLPVKNSMDLADEILRDLDADEDEEPPVTVNHVFSSKSRPDLSKHSRFKISHAFMVSTIQAILIFI